MVGPRPFAVFDIDGTLIRWQLYHALADELARQGHFDGIAFEKVRQARMTWKKRDTEDSFHHYEVVLIHLVDAAISGIPVIDLETASRTVISEYKDQVYTYSRDLLLDLKQKNYLLFTLSGSQSIIVKLLAQYYGFDDYGGTEYEVKDGHFTGKKTLLRSAAKPAYLKKLVSKHQASWQGSIAIGDSEGDIPMLESVEKPIAFNPTKELFKHAQTNNWKIVIERKNMIYELEPDNDSYSLK